MEVVSNEHLGTWLAALAIVLILVNLGLQIVEKMRPNPPLHRAYVGRDEHVALVGRVGAVESTVSRGLQAAAADRFECRKECAALIDSKMAAAMRSNSESREKMYLAIRDLEKLVAKLSERGEHHSAVLQNMDRKLESLNLKVK